MADRVRAFQDVVLLESRAPTFHLPPRSLTHGESAGVYSGHGRRKSSSFASPAERASRDGNEGFRGDGRPPVGTIPSSRPGLVQELGEQGTTSDEVSMVRPVTSMGQASQGQLVSRRQTLGFDTRPLHRKSRSMENVADPGMEIATARSRLRSVAGGKPAKDSPQSTRTDTLAELGHLLDNAIEDNASRPGVLSDEATQEASPRLDLTRGPSTSNLAPRQSSSRERPTRQSTDSVAPRSSSESVRVEYAGHRPTPAGPHGEDRDTSKKPSLTANAEHVGELHGGSPSRLFLHPNGPLLSQPDREISPVRQRAAMFESLVQKPSEHDEVCHHFQRPESPPRHDHDTHKETRKMHRIKFGNTVEERPGTPLIPLTLPNMVGSKPKGGRSSSTVKAELREQDRAERAGEKASGDGGLGHDKQRASSLNWPFRWSIFNKSPSAPPPAPPQATETTSTAHGEKDERHPPTGRPSVVQSRVQDLLQAANVKDDAEKRRRHSELEHLAARRQSRPPAAPVTQTELNEDQANMEDLTPALVPPFQLPVRTQVDGLKPPTAADDGQGEPKTPLQKAMTEKQVLSPPNVPGPSNDMSPSPRKSTPRTPIRGRSRKSVRRLSGGEQPRGMEQHFKLSPGPSRSGSRNGRRGVKVEVEVRDSPEREARERGEKIVIIRADVEAIQEDD